MAVEQVSEHLNINLIHFYKYGCLSVAGKQMVESHINTCDLCREIGDVFDLWQKSGYEKCLSHLTLEVLEKWDMRNVPERRKKSNE
jgi:hypothetical protein